MPLSPSLNALSPCKAKGQHFLIHTPTLERIAAEVAKVYRLDQDVVEIGPGKGALSKALLQYIPKEKLHFLEKDQRFHEILTTLIPNGNIFFGDALELPWPESPGILVGNLPYNVSVPLLLKFIHKGGNFSHAVFMFQKEVAQRVMAKVHESHYGRLSIMTQSYTVVKKCMDVSPGCFWPRPKVTSTVLTFERIQPTPLLPQWNALETITALAFQKRRKMIRHTFVSLGITEEDLIVLGLDPALRPENLSLDAYSRLSQIVKTYPDITKDPTML